MKRRSLVALIAVAVFAGGLYAADEIDLKDIKCVVAGAKPAKADNSVDYKEGKVFFCCQNCPKAFEKDTAKFASKANKQLVATKQYKEVKCPLSGEALNPDTAIEVAGVKVAFCCNNCKGKVAKAKDDEQIDLVFSDGAFKKGFEVAKKK
jgi:YHS domain-containing protein